MSRRRSIIWDFDGTLARRDRAWAGAALDVFAAHGIAPHLTASDLRPYLTAGFRWHRADQTYLAEMEADQWWRELDLVFGPMLTEAAGVPSDEVGPLSDQIRKSYLDASKWSLFADTIPVLDALASAGWLHLLLTNHVPELGEILRSLQLEGRFESVFNSASTGFEKPHPQAFATVRSHFPDAELWMVGDNVVADVQGAEAAGIPAILVRNSHPDAKVSFADLLGVQRYLGC